MTRAHKRGPTAYPVSSVGNALELLELLVEKGDLHLTEVGAALGIAPSTAHRLLTMFREAEYLQQPVRYGPYQIGPRLTRIAAALATGVTLTTAMRPHLLDLLAETNESVHLAVLSGNSVKFLDSAVPQSRGNVESGVGRTLPAYATAAGKVLLAGLALPELMRLYPSADLLQLTPHTLSNRESLIGELQRTRDRGYAVNRGEVAANISAYAWALQDRNGNAYASLVVTAPTKRARRGNAEPVLAALHAAARAAERSLQSALDSAASVSNSAPSCGLP